MANAPVCASARPVAGLARERRERLQHRWGGSLKPQHAALLALRDVEVSVVIEGQPLRGPEPGGKGGEGLQGAIRVERGLEDDTLGLAGLVLVPVLAVVLVPLV